MSEVPSVQDCDFCKIASLLEPARIVFESGATLAFFPEQPATLGHTLVIPKVHVRDFLALEGKLAHELTESVLHVGRALSRALAPAGMNAITSAGVAATQTVFHLHVHLVPRWPNDPIGNIWPPSEPTSEKAKDEVADAVRIACCDIKPEEHC